MPRPVDPRRSHVLECLSSEVRSVGDLKAFVVQEIGASYEMIVNLALLVANHGLRPADDTALTADFCGRMLTWLRAHTRVIDEIDAMVGGDQDDPPRCAECVITVQALIQRLGQ